MLLNLLAYAVVAGVTVQAKDPFAVALSPSDQWFGIDGNWSAVKFLVGTPSPVTLHVLVSTWLSEFWLVGSGGCLSNSEPHCTSARGEVFTIGNSKSWFPLGSWQLGLDHLFLGGNGDYGLESLAIYSPVMDNAFAMDNVVTAVVNTTDYYLGYFGLGITQGKFGDRIVESPLTQMVKTFGWIPSYSYGYTAGAYYMGPSGTPCSVTLGGYDEQRFVPHGVEFTLNQTDGLPHALVRGIEVTVPEGHEAPAGWNGKTKVLSSMNNSFTAMIDSSTPYLWLPDAVCDQFEAAFGLTYNDTFDLYTLSNEQYAAFRARSFSFTFSFSSFDNRDDFGRPLNVPGVVNITITAAAFAQVLRYPFMQETIKYGQPAVPYFPLRRADKGSKGFIIGRSFLQEAYMITKYDSGVFSLHQAKFPENIFRDTEIKIIPQPPNSPYPPPPPQIYTNTGLTTVQMAGIAAGVVVVCLVLLLTWCCCRKKRRRRKRNQQNRVSMEEEGKDGASSIAPETPQTPVARILSLIIRRKRSRRPETRDAPEEPNPAAEPVEVAADANHELFELPVPIGPAELDADTHSINGDTELDTEGSQNLSAYEIARRKMERQLQGPVPAYTPPVDTALAVATGQGEGAAARAATSGEKSMQDVSPVATYRPSDNGSPASSPTAYGPSTNSFPDTLPSPMTPRGEWTFRFPDLPSPMTVAPPVPSPLYTGSSSGPSSYPSANGHSPTFEASPVSRSNSGNTSAEPQSATSVAPASPTYQRTAIDPSRIVCLGPLPENVSLPEHDSVPRLVGSDGRPLPLPGMLPEAHQSTDTLGSNYTEVEEQRIVEEMTRQASLCHTQQQNHLNQSAEPETPRSPERIDAGSELIHVPQLAERRYSWEDDR